MAIEYTHDGMIDYPKDISNMKVNTIWMVLVNKEKFVEPWLDCALHVKCIALGYYLVLTHTITMATMSDVTDTTNRMTTYPVADEASSKLNKINSTKVQNPRRNS